MYLSMVFYGLYYVLFIGGFLLIDDGCIVEVVYCVCYKRVVLQNVKYYKWFFGDVEIVRLVVFYFVQFEGGGVSF